MSRQFSTWRLDVGGLVEKWSLMKGCDLEAAHGALLRLRVERQLGYKQAKYLTRIEAVADLGQLCGGNGGFWEDRGYECYAGI
ncbi:DMSO/TMAO reductase YedYZ molybdopterin-dependent catalytic subunit [Rhizobium binae]|uniref:DMSO/TMAO reductase YedYZ molybdopterin-dependent catalytic subunit n=1 Tax=Rhizobium binae TaxID=1138190 RepID=A0ABV2MPX5_9HYPH